MKTALRILEPILLVLAVAWALVVVFVGGAGQGDFWTHLFALMALIIFGFIPYAIVAGILHRLRAKTPEDIENSRGGRFSKILAWIAGISILFAIVGAFISAYYLPKTQVGVESAVPERHFWTHEYQPLHMRVTIGDEWRQIPAEGIEFPQDITGARFAFRKEGTSCVLAYATAPENAFQNYIDITNQMAAAGKITSANVLNRIYNSKLSSTFGITAQAPSERLASLNEQFGSSNQAPSLRFSDGGIIFVSSHLVEFMESSRQAPVFVLFDEGTNAPWDGHCLSDMVKVIENVDWLYDPITLTTQSEGALYITSEEVNGAEIDQVRFIPSGTDTPHTVVGMTATSRPMPQIVDGKLYVVVEGELRTLNPFNKTTSNALDIDLPENERVQAFQIENDRILYLAGKNCLIYMEDCDLNLYEYNRAGQRSTKLAEHLPYREIIGYDKDAGEILLAYRDGDAGCSWGQTGIYNYEAKEIQNVRKVSACGDDERLLPDYVAYQNEIKRFTRMVPTHDYVWITNGTLVAPTQPISNREDRWTIAYP